MVPLVEITRVEITLETPVTQEIQEIQGARLSRNLQVEMEAVEIAEDTLEIQVILLEETVGQETFTMMLI